MRGSAVVNRLNGDFAQRTFTQYVTEAASEGIDAIFSQVVQPHVPMIKFRKGGINHAVAGTTAAPSARSSGPSQTQQSAGNATGPGVIVLPTIEDLHLPPRYQRQSIDEKEIEYINRGGPE
ncbi:alpha-ketoglutarate dehydrogenase component 4 isoform X2 [Polyergus mexicanus]|uniref:alpha-ketoglutarate dehydrogenase component 4 isoform X2 n=1 Tax=Polyergus mexicanus TaxID=615972 RepID=UPI0038B4BD0A